MNLRGFFVIYLGKWPSEMWLWSSNLLKNDMFKLKLIISLFTHSINTCETSEVETLDDAIVSKYLKMEH